MTTQEAAIAKLRQLPEPLAKLVLDFIDFLLSQWATIPTQPPIPPLQTSQLTSDLPAADYPNLKQVGPFWVVKATHPPSINWDTLVQDDRESRVDTLMGFHHENPV